MKNKLNINLKLFNTNGSIIEENGEIHLVKDIVNDGDFIFSNIANKSLVLLLCKNQYESIFFYINSISRGIVPILIDSESDYSLISSLIIKYQPEYIFSPASNNLTFDNYHICGSFGEFSLLKYTEIKLSEINHQLALLLSTSGTTGSPKLVRLSLDNLIENATAIAEYLNLNSTERAISSLPMNYSFGLSIINSHLFVGGSIVITSEAITQRGFWTLFNKFKVTSLSGVPYTFEILKKFKLLNAELPSLKTITQAGGKLANELVNHFAQFAVEKNLQFFVMYGQTEGTARLSYLAPKFVLDKLGSIGKPIPNGKFDIIDEHGKIITESGKSGELIYTGPNVMLGYANCKLDLAKGDENCGILKTGDIAQFDEDGFFYIVGRIKRFIKIFGNRVNLDELEMLLFSNGVESACIGSDNSLIVCITNSDLKAHTKDFLFKKLGIHFSAFEIRIINAIPKSNSGKTLYSKLTEIL
jgi:long-chain acyl-CoA synthetase